MHIYCS